MAKKPHFAILHYSCPPVVGGVEFIIRAHARLLADYGFRTRLIVGEGAKVHDRVPTVVIPELGSDGGAIADVLHALREGRVPDGFESAVRRVEAALSKALRGVDVCMMHNVLTMHFNLVLTAALARIMARSRTKRFIGWTHDSTFADPAYVAQQRHEYPWDLLTQHLPGCRYCVISVQRQRELARIFGVDPAQLPVIPDGIDVKDLLGLTPQVWALFSEERFYRKDIVALTPTRMVRRKNLGKGIEIVAALKRSGQSVTWMITGVPDPYNPDSMQYFEELSAQCRRLDVEDEVMFLWKRFGREVSREDLRGLYAMSDLLLFPSEREGFGIPVLEAGISGLLVVISDIPALRELGQHDTVYIKPDETADAVAERTVRALRHSPRLVFKKRVIETYSWDALFSDRILPALLEPDTVWNA